MFGKRKEKRKEFSFEEHGIRHIAFIMDGNGRWAKKRGMPREYGHKKGAEVFDRIVRHCFARGVSFVTVYAFSTENWSRPRHEVDSIMELLSKYLDYAEEKFVEYDVRLIFLGDKSKLADDLRAKAEHLEQITASHPRVLNIALNYGARDELTHAFRLLAEQGKKDITAADIQANLYTAFSPDPDLIVRTGGDYRISNFLLWQAAYSEFYFTPTLWPALTEKEVDEAMLDFSRRHRRFGGL